MHLYWFQIIISLLVGAIAAILANWRGRSSLFWFCLAALLGPLGLLVLLFIPKIQIVTYVQSTKKNVQQQEEAVPLQAAAPEEFSTSWFYIDVFTKEAKGPLEFVDLQKLWKEGLIEKKSFVWSKKLPNWTKISDLEPLYRLLQG